MPSRHASHSGSWYSDSARTLARQLDGWLAQVPDTMEKVGSLPTPGARVIIAPYVWTFIIHMVLCRTNILINQACGLFILGALRSLRIQGAGSLQSVSLSPASSMKVSNLTIGSESLSWDRHTMFRSQHWLSRR